MNVQWGNSEFSSFILLLIMNQRSNTRCRIRRKELFFNQFEERTECEWA